MRLGKRQDLVRRQVARDEVVLTKVCACVHKLRHSSWFSCYLTMATWNMFYSCFFVFIIYSLAEGKGTKYIPPVVLIPGCGGSQLEAKIDTPASVRVVCNSRTNEWFTMWLNIDLIIPSYIDCFVAHMKLEYDNVTRTTRNAAGVETRIPGFGNSSTVEWLNPGDVYLLGYFNNLVSGILPLGYERGVTLRGAPYDFRKAPNELGEYFLNLRDLIESTRVETGHKVVLVAHSMGAPLVHYFLNYQPQSWKDQYIETLVTLSGAWAGSVKAVHIYATGDNLGIPFLKASKARIEQVTLPSLSFLLPSSQVWGPEEVLIQTKQRNYSTGNFKELFENLKLPDAYDMYLDTKNLLHLSTAPGVEIHCIHGEGVATVEKLVYDDDNFPNNPQVVTGAGDGSVNARSTRFCLNFAKKQEQKIYHHVLNKVDHMGVLYNSESITYLTNLLANISRKNEQHALMMKNLIQAEKGKEKQFVWKYPGMEEADEIKVRAGLIK
ncbi:lysosomal phospholipase A and acyltransferase-like [Cherax quadricarinatus]|uniref:lysosomal phospholipase A and acyltransferase-like n=1 Tax=Cherax quadricarinatus TaxID=27406 RepID=UPI00387E6099